MNYFVGSLYGNYNNYCEIKRQLKLKPHDTLWILGDILDGNDENPEDCISILYDIMNSSNIHLVLGDHEFAHIMRHLSITDKERYETWGDYIENLEVSGTSLLYYIENILDDYEKDELFGFLINECEITNFIRIGDNYFYLVHGFPSVYKRNTSEWQLLSTTNTIQDINYIQAIKTDPSVPDEYIKTINSNNCFVICSHQNNIDNTDTFFKNGVFLLNENIPNKSICILGIDAAGYFNKEIIY